ncbi:MAG TPA: HTH domain-containing protein [Puia sp.]|nr:HTH domain-containing protein [Puia sp.]
MNRIDRLIGMLTLLQSKKFVTAGHFARKFNISVRTVYRDIKALLKSNVPVSYEINRGYFVVRCYSLPPVSFTAEEANAMIMMEAIAGRVADQSVRQYYGSALIKIKGVLQLAGTDEGKQNFG